MYMSTGKLTTLLTAAALLVPPGLSAQGHASHHPGADATPPAPGMMGQESGMSSMMSQQMLVGMMHPGPRMILGQRDALQLSADQVEALEQLRVRADELRATHGSQMTSIRERLAVLRGGDDLDLGRFGSLLRDQADLRVDTRVQAAQIHRDALDVLTDAQRSNVRYGMRMMRSEGGMSAGMPGSGSGMMGMMRMHRQDCPMTTPDAGSDG